MAKISDKAAHIKINVQSQHVIIINACLKFLLYNPGSKRLIINIELSALIKTDILMRNKYMWHEIYT